MKYSFYRNIILVFVSSFCLMTIELIAGRIIARYLGSSLYTWTAVIAVILGGISLGNYIGGKMADKWEPRDLLGYIFIIASLMCIIIPLINYGVEKADALAHIAWPIRIFLSTFFVFFIPSCCLGCISPIVAKLALLEGKDEIGRTVGTLYAWGAIGSILGTLLTGYIFIAWLGVKTIIILVAFILSLLCLWVSTTRRIPAFWALILFLGLVITLSDGNEYEKVSGLRLFKDNVTGIYAHDSAYQFVNVYHKSDSSDLLVLRLDNLIHSYCSPNDPMNLEYDYEKIYTAATNRLMMNRKSPRFMFIGGGGYTLPRLLEASYPDGYELVAEIDPKVTEVAHKYLGLNPNSKQIKIDNRDGRLVVEDLARKGKEKFDFIYTDAFNDLTVPYHLTTYEFLVKIRKILKPDGVYLVNIIDILDMGKFLAATVQTSRQVFPYVRVFIGADHDPKQRNTFVIIASLKPLDLDDLGQREKEYQIKTQEIQESTLQGLVKKTKYLILTDDYVPVDRLIAGVLWERRK